MYMKLVLNDEKIASIMRECDGDWCFHYATAYVLSIKTQRNRLEIGLREQDGGKWILSHLKTTPYFMELFAFNELFDDSMSIRIYPRENQEPGLEVSKTSCFHRSGENIKNRLCPTK